MSEDRKRERPLNYFTDWKEREALAEAMIPLVGGLYRGKNLKLYLYGQSLVGRSTLQIMQAHRFVREVEHNELSEFETFPLLQALTTLELGTAHIDIGRLTVGYLELESQPTPEQYLRDVLRPIIGRPSPRPSPRDVVLFGFGRIGRLVMRLLIEKVGSGDTLRPRAVVVRQGGAANLIKRAELLRRDSIHGGFQGTIRIDEERNSFVANGNEILLLHADNPEDPDYLAHDIHDALIVDNTGKWRDSAGLKRHLKAAGSAKVLLTAPGRDGVKNIVHGINHQALGKDDHVVSAASCTTNAIVPPLQAMHERFGILHGHVETVHAYTNDQNLTDNYHKKVRRGRSAPLNMVLTSTGAVDAVAQILPQLGNRLSGNAIRVPVANVSIAILNLLLKRSTSSDEVNEYMRHMALHSPLRKQIGYTNSQEVSSSDFIGSRQSCVLDSRATIVNQDRCILYLWYDNEFGYACQVMRVLEEMAGIRYPVFPQLKDD